jgi:hypothetical protein
MALIGTVALQIVEEALEGAILDFLFPSGKTHFVTHARTLISHSYLRHTPSVVNHISNFIMMNNVVNSNTRKYQ